MTRHYPDLGSASDWLTAKFLPNGLCEITLITLLQPIKALSETPLWMAFVLIYYVAEIIENNKIKR